MFCTSCGRELPDGSKFCSGCGLPIENVEVEKTVDNQSEDYSEQTYDNSAYSQNAYNQNEYSQNGYSQNAYNQNAYSYQQPQNPQKNAYIAYKKKVAPFKVIAAIINLLTTFTLGFMALAFIGIGLGEEGMDAVEKVNSDVTTGFMICGLALLIFSFIMFVASIVAIIVPAKAGVICNLIFTVITFIFLIWSVILNMDLSGVADTLSSPFGYSTESAQLISDMVVGLYVFIFLNAAGEFISFILSVIGMMFKKNK